MDWGAATAALLRLCGKLYELVDLVCPGGKGRHQPNQALVRLQWSRQAFASAHIIARARGLEPRFQSLRSAKKPQVGLDRPGRWTAAGGKSGGEAVGHC